MADPSPTLEALCGHLRNHLTEEDGYDVPPPSKRELECIVFLCREIDALRLENAEVRAEIRVLSGKGTPGLTLLTPEETSRAVMDAAMQSLRNAAAVDDLVASIVGKGGDDG